MPLLTQMATSPKLRNLRRGWFELKRRIIPSLNTVVFYHRVNDPYSFLLLQALPRFLEDFKVNLIGAVNVIHAALSRLKKSPTPASIIMFSTVAVQTGLPFHASIASAKGAVEGLTRSLAAEFAPKIRVNAVAPSLTDTPLAESLLSSEDKRNASAARHPLGRIGRPSEIAHLVSLLLSDSGSWITGQVFHVDGGMSKLRTFK